MRDIGRRIQRYRLSRYASPGGGPVSPPRWVWLLAAAWLIYISLLSEHSLYRIWRLSEERTRAGRELGSMQAEIMRLDREARDPQAQMRAAERALRRDGFARPGEIVYRIGKDAPDSLKR
jgi:cell division protein FtsB